MKSGVLSSIHAIDETKGVWNWGPHLSNHDPYISGFSYFHTSLCTVFFFYLYMSDINLHVPYVQTQLFFLALYYVSSIFSYVICNPLHFCIFGCKRPPGFWPDTGNHVVSCLPADLNKRRLTRCSGWYVFKIRLVTWIFVTRFWTSPEWVSFLQRFLFCELCFFSFFSLHVGFLCQLFTHQD